MASPITSMRDARRLARPEVRAVRERSRHGSHPCRIPPDIWRTLTKSGYASATSITSISASLVMIFPVNSNSEPINCGSERSLDPSWKKALYTNALSPTANASRGLAATLVFC